MKMRVLALSAALTASGIALACNQDPIPLPPIPPIEVGMVDLSSAWLDGYKTQAAMAAALKKLDEQAASIVGAANWKSNYFAGYVTYKATLRGSFGGVMLYVEKPCDKNAQDQAERRTRETSWEDGGMDRTNENPYSTTTRGIVGYRAVVRTWSACAGDACSTGEYVEYEPIWGTYTHVV